MDGAVYYGEKTYYELVMGSLHYKGMEQLVMIRPSRPALYASYYLPSLVAYFFNFIIGCPLTGKGYKPHLV